jgi:hypothetical protein
MPRRLRSGVGNCAVGRVLTVVIRQGTPNPGDQHLWTESASRKDFWHNLITAVRIDAQTAE